jgi:hypothetical protein
MTTNYSFSAVQIVANATEFKNGNKGFKVEVKGMEGKLNITRSFTDPLKTMRFMFMLSKKLELGINKIDLAAVSVAYQKAKAELAQASAHVNEVAANAQSDAQELEKDSEAEASDSDSSEDVTHLAYIQQFNELKEKHPEALLLFRCGDFYETYENDAQIASEVLGITLTLNTRDKRKMAGFPHHALDSYLPKLIRAGHRVAICDQLEAPKKSSKKIEKAS